MCVTCKRPWRPFQSHIWLSSEAELAALEFHYDIVGVAVEGFVMSTELYAEDHPHYFHAFLLLELQPSLFLKVSTHTLSAAISAPYYLFTLSYIAAELSH